MAGTETKKQTKIVEGTFGGHYKVSAKTVQFENLIKYGVSKDKAIIIHHADEVEAMLRLMRVVVVPEGEVTDSEIELIRSHLETVLAPGITAEQKDGFIDYFRNLDTTNLKLKECCQLFKTRSRPNKMSQFIDILYQLAYFHGIDQKMQIVFQDVGQFLNIRATEMRQAAFAARKMVESDEPDSSGEVDGEN
ncbi:MAG: TerB family tellurite resistance protein [Calditrichaeota bacterium]|nr:TerB family tellurite resistance protein [Calditrichota bacterium]